LSSPKIRIGTSGYTYTWNKGKPDAFRWYLNQGFNSVEINASFYRFPEESWIANWLSNSPKDFTFSVKVHRSITHYNRLKGKRSVELWQRFSILIIAIIGSVASIIAYLVLTWNKRLQSVVNSRTKELTSAYEELKIHDKAQKEFIDVAAHELRTPMLYQ
jgi:uncharacterized protein YecE (DUF72 family)